MRVCTVLFVLCSALLFGCGGGPDDTPLIVQAPDPPPVLAPPPDPPPVIPPVSPPPIEPPPVEPPPPAVVRLTFAFHGVLVDGGTVDGTVTYAKDSPVVGTNVRGLAPNVTYALVGWNLTVHQTTFVLPNVVFTSALPGQAEFCIGECIFSPLRMQRLLFRSGTSSLALMFLLPEGMSEALPSTLTDWVPFAVNLSEFRMLLDAETVWPMTSGTLTVVE